MPNRVPPRHLRQLFAAGPNSRILRALLCTLVAPASVAAQGAGAASLLAADRAVASRTSDGVAALVAAAAPDVVFLYGVAPIVRGREAMAALLDSAASSAHARLGWTALRADVSADDARGYTYGRGERTTRVGDRDSTAGIRYAAWWRRDDGAWRIAALLLIDERAGADTSRWSCTSVTPAVAHAARDASDMAREVVGADSSFAARSLGVGPATAFADYAADDGVSLGGAGVPACGKRAIGAQLEGVAPTDLAWSPIVGDAAPSGDLGYTAGTATIRTTRGVRYGKYLTIWKRQGDGTWRFVADGGSAAPARQRTLAVR